MALLEDEHDLRDPRDQQDAPARRLAWLPAPIRRRLTVRLAIAVTVAVLAAVALVPRLGELGAVRDELAGADWRWLVPVVLFEVLTYVGAGVALAGSVPNHVRLGPTIRAQVAAAFVDIVSPHSVGGMALNARFLQRQGVEPGAAVAGVGVNVLGGVVAHVLLLAGVAVWAGTEAVPAGSSEGGAFAPSPWLLAPLAAAIVAVALLGAHRRGRRLVRERIVPHLEDARRGLRGIGNRPRKLAGVVGGSALTTIAFTGSFVATVQAFGGGISIAALGATYLGAWAVAAFAPTPGGLGALELALVAGLTRLGMGADLALSTIVVFRALTFWLPVLPGWVMFQWMQRRGEI
jgi:uncharacterized membrane protein YbhN (UPF0104 family)